MVPRVRAEGEGDEVCGEAYVGMVPLESRSRGGVERVDRWAAEGDEFRGGGVRGDGAPRVRLEGRSGTCRLGLAVLVVESTRRPL